MQAGAVRGAAGQWANAQMSPQMMAQQLQQQQQQMQQQQMQIQQQQQMQRQQMQQGGQGRPSPQATASSLMSPQMAGSQIPGQQQGQVFLKFVLISI
jgi:hypothetical protein